MKILSDQTTMSASHRLSREQHTAVSVNLEWQSIFDLAAAESPVIPVDAQTSGEDGESGSLARQTLRTRIVQMELQMLGLLQSLQGMYSGELEPITISGEVTESRSLFDHLIAAFEDRDILGGLGGFSFSSARLSFRSVSAGGWGMADSVLTARTTCTETLVEAETTSFYAGGQVNLADGRSVDFSLSLAMERETLQETSFSQSQAVFLLDPLVLSLDGMPPELDDLTFRFDLDADGSEEEIPRLASGAGYLAFDRNHDGVVNSGEELFGPESGNGFSELALWDSDENSWIDENDPIFNDLSIWTWDPETGDQLQGLSEAGIGAIHLAALETPFDQMGENGTLLGQTRRTGIYLEESTGMARAIQQLDLNRFLV